MSGIRNHIKYSSGLREVSYKLLKACDRFRPYTWFYKRRINKRAANIRPFPSELSIETTNLCNARCTICAHPQMRRAKGKMDSALVRSIIDQAKHGDVERLLLSGFGEPLLDKRLPEFVAYARDSGIERISIVTNGYLLSPALANELVDAGLREMIISMDGFTAETYESIRLGLNFEQLLDNLKSLPATMNRKQARITISCVNLPHNAAEREIASALLGRHVDGIYFRQAQGWTGAYKQEPGSYSPHFEPNAIPCRYLWDSASVYIDGSVPVCCLDYEATAVMGNARSESLEEIWRGLAMNRYRQSHLQRSKHTLNPCRRCGYYPVWW